jgi:hypothetical protein
MAEEHRMTKTIICRILATLIVLATVASSADAQKPKFDVTGTWAFEVQTDQGAGSPTISFKQDGDKLTGHYAGTFGESDLTGTVSGADISFSFNASVQGISLTSTYKGTVESETAMKGTVTIEQVGGGTFTAKKK